MVHQNIDALQQELERLKPGATDALDNLRDWYRVELTYTSTAIEGNKLGRSGTALVLEKGIAIGGKSLTDHMEVLDHGEAVERIYTLARTEAPVSENTILDLHRLAMRRSEPHFAGTYSIYPRRISGSAAVLPKPAEIPGLMESFGQDLERRTSAGRTSEPAYRVAFDAHYDLVTIHPFSDGNGRTARLLMNLILLGGGYPPVVIGPPDREAYIDALERAQVTGERGDYDRFMEGRLLASLQDHLAHLG